MAETSSAEVAVLAEPTQRRGLFYGWYVVAAAAAINVYGAGVWFYGFPIFFKVLLDEFGWSAAAGAAVISLSRLEGGLEGPIIGWAVDKFGPRRMAVIGAVIAGTGFMLMSRVTSLDIGPVHLSAFVIFVLLYAGWMSIGYNTGFGHASQAAVNAWFIKKRSRAFAVFSLGAGGSGLTVFALGWVVNGYGWRTAAFLAGVGIFFIVIPLSMLLRHKPEQYGYLPRRRRAAERGQTAPRRRSRSRTGRSGRSSKAKPAAAGCSPQRSLPPIRTSPSRKPSPHWPSGCWCWAPPPGRLP